MAKNKKFFEINNLTEGVAEIRIYGTITKWAWEEVGEVSSHSFAKELKNLKNISKINLRVNSGGGDVFEANAIFNLLKSYAKENNVEITGYIDGLAASAASFLVLCAHKVIMGVGCLFMIHNPWTYTKGNVKELGQTIDFLNKIKESILDIYETKTKLTRQEISQKMDEEKWFSASEALESGFVDEISEMEDVENNILNAAGENFVQNFINSEILKNKVEEIKNKIKLENNQGGKEMPKNLQELLAQCPDLMNEYKAQVVAEIANQEKEKVEAAIKEERNRIKALESIPVLNDKQKEIITKAKYEEARDPKDIMAEFYMSNANKAAAEIQTATAEANEAGLNTITPSVTNEVEEGVVDQLCAAAKNIFDGEK